MITNLTVLEKEKESTSITFKCALELLFPDMVMQLTQKLNL